jgi:hypothetical protein
VNLLQTRTTANESAAAPIGAAAGFASAPGRNEVPQLGSGAFELTHGVGHCCMAFCEPS